MAELNQRVQGPYGDIYMVNTPHLDQLGRDFYKQEQLDKQRKYQEAKASDDEFSKNLSKVRTADIPDFTDAYKQFKLANIDLMKKGDKATWQDRQNVLQKKADTYKILNNSVKENAVTEEARKDAILHPDKYHPEALQILTQRNSIPISKMQFDVPKSISSPEGTAHVDITDPFNTIQSPDDNTDYNKSVNAAAGKLQYRGNPVQKEIDNGLSTETTRYKGLNHPSEIAHNLLLNGDKWVNGFAKKNQYTDEKLADLTQKYETLRQTPEWKAAYPNDQPLPQSLFLTKQGRAIAGKSMEIAIGNALSSEVKNAKNEGAIMAAKNTEWDRRNKIGFKESLAKIAANKAAGLPPENTGYLSDNVADDAGENIAIPPPVAKNLGLPENVEGYKIVYTDKVDPERLNIIRGYDKGQPGVAPLQVPQPNGSTRSAFVVDIGTGDWLGNNGQKISREAVKDRYIKQVSPTKFKTQIGTKAVEKKETTAKNSKWDKYKVQ